MGALKAPVRTLWGVDTSHKIIRQMSVKSGAVNLKCYQKVYFKYISWLLCWMIWLPFGADNLPDGTSLGEHTVHGTLLGDGASSP